MPAATLHIVFSDAFVRSLTQVLRQAGLDGRVLAFPDDLSFGPINPPEPAARRNWIREKLAPDLRDWELPSGRIAAFWKTALSPSRRRIVWVSTRVTREVAGFLEFVWRLGDADCQLIEFDTDEVTYRRNEGNTSSSRAICLAALPQHHLATKRYWDRAVPFDAITRERYRASWERLREENAPLRTLAETGLISTPITYFDDLLIACTIERWRKAARVISEALSNRPFCPVGGFALAARLRALAEAGRLEGRGDLRKVRYSEVRLPTTQDASSSVSQ